MHDLAPTTALGGTIAATNCFGSLSLSEVPMHALASLAQRTGSTAPELPGLPLPAPGRWTQGGELAALWIGPGQWMIERPGQAGVDFAARIAALARGASVTEQTDAWVMFDVTSSAGAEPILRLLERLVNLDPARLEPGAATRTGLGHQSVFVIRRATDRLSVLAMRSFAGSTWQILTNAAARLCREGH